MAGMTLGHYTILDKLGAGGMGEVYRAEDTKLGRQVAIKVLPENFAGDEERMARFEREARTLAALNHPNIAAIHGLEEDSGKSFLVMELVEGETLDQKLTKGALPVDEAIEVCRQIAEAVEAAHEKGIIHRDLKPANVKITPEARVKVLDFGLAKALIEDQDGPVLMESPTLTAQMTQPGIILGTAPYMSPEQAKGKAVDKRTDIWAFGCILYECLTGKMAFSGDSVSEILAAILKEEPDWSLLPSNLHPSIRLLLQHCLNKNPRNRLQHIGDARLDLQDIPSFEELLAAERDPHIKPVSPAKRGILIALIGVLPIAAALAAWFLKPTFDPPMRKFPFDISTPFLSIDGPAISPDGTKLAYVDQNRLWIRELDALVPREINDTEGAYIPFWSPDSNSIAYVVGDGTIKKVPAQGGESQIVCESLAWNQGAVWSADDTIIYPMDQYLYSISIQGQQSHLLFGADSGKNDINFFHPHVLPDDRGLLFVSSSLQGKKIEVFSGSSREILIEHGEDQLLWPVYSPTGHILYERRSPSRSIWAIPFDLSRLEPTGDPFLVAANGYRPTVSRDGTLVYRKGTGMQQLVWLDRSGQEMGTIGPPQPQIDEPELSPDNSRVAVQIRSEEIHIFDVNRGAETRFTFFSVYDDQPTWYPLSADRIVFVSSRDGPNSIYVQNIEGSDVPRRLVEHEIFAGAPDISPDEKYLIYHIWDSEGQYDIMFMPLAGAGKPNEFMASPFDEAVPKFSPDGRYVAYQSDESGDWEIFIRSFPGGEEKEIVSIEGGRNPVWSGTGDELFFVAPGDIMMAAKIDLRSGIKVDTPKKLFTWQSLIQTHPLYTKYDVSSDGQRFVVVKSLEDDKSQIVVVENWFKEFEGKISDGK